jgi:hypothetical protein
MPRRRLTLSEFTGIAEIIGTVAIVVSLIFVGLQLRQNSSQFQTAAIQAGMTYVEAMNNLFIDPDTTELVITGLNDFSGLTQLEKARFDGLMYNIITKYFVTRQYFDQGGLSQTDIDSYDEALAMLLKSPGAVQWWKLSKDGNPPFVQDRIDNILRSYPDVEPYSEHLKF